MVTSKFKFSILAVVSFLAVLQSAEAVSVVSNLGNIWPQNGTIGDIHGVFRGGTPYGSDTASFTTGAGTFSLNSITLEFEFGSSFSSPQWLEVQLFQNVGGAQVFVGNLGNAVANPTPTQWPQSPTRNAYTEFFDYSPDGSIELDPFSQYYVTISMPANSPVNAALMFTRSGAYTSEDGWTMGPTVSGDPFAAGEYLKLGVDASQVPDAANTTLLLIIGLGVIAGWRMFGKAGHSTAH